MRDFKELIGIDLNDAVKLIEKDKINYELVETKSIFGYVGYQYRVVRIQENNGVFKLTISKF